jgi:Tfp pilus assembly protein PilX
MGGSQVLTSFVNRAVSATIQKGADSRVNDVEIVTSWTVGVRRRSAECYDRSMAVLAADKGVAALEVQVQQSRRYRMPSRCLGGNPQVGEADLRACAVALPQKVPSMMLQS